MLHHSQFILRKGKFIFSRFLPEAETVIKAFFMCPWIFNIHCMHFYGLCQPLIFAYPIFIRYVSMDIPIREPSLLLTVTLFVSFVSFTCSQNTCCVLFDSSFVCYLCHCLVLPCSFCTFYIYIYYIFCIINSFVSLLYCKATWATPPVWN